MTPDLLRGLYAVTQDGAATGDLLARVRAVLTGGARLVQYRNKSAEPSSRRIRAQALLALCREFRVPLIINDDLALALEIGADGVHLGRDDGDLAAARYRLGADRLLGVSCYNELERARRAAQAGADYVAVGSVFASSTKPQAVRAALTLLTQVRRELGLPVAAIGGITLDNAQQVIAAGADMLAVISDLFDADDIAARAAAYAALFPVELQTS